MNENPIAFIGEMVSAILDGRKTQTRRILKVQPDLVANNIPVKFTADDIKLGRIGAVIPCPFGAVGDRLWVRETHSTDFAHHYPHDRCWYAADDDRKSDIEVRNGTRGIWSPESNTFVPFKWRPPIQMPRWACRILLEITDIRVEHLHDISKADAIAEGVIPYQVRQISLFGASQTQRDQMYRDSAVAPFRELWKSTGGDWDANPWVWVISFKCVQS